MQSLDDLPAALRSAIEAAFGAENFTIVLDDDQCFARDQGIAVLRLRFRVGGSIPLTPELIALPTDDAVAKIRSARERQLGRFTDLYHLPVP